MSTAEFRDDAAVDAPPLPPGEVGGEEKMPAEPADPVTGVPPDPASAFESTQGTLEIYFDESDRLFWVRNEDKRWINLSEGGLKRRLKKELGLRDKPNPGKAISPLDEEVSRIENNQRVAYAGLLAGYKAGLHVVRGRLVLVTEDPKFIEPAKGEWPILAAFFEGLLVGEEPLGPKGEMITIDQRDHFFGWLRHVVECYRHCRRSRGLALGLAGEPDCGKSFLAWLLSEMLGGRVGKPYSAMTGQDMFNRDSVECVLQLVDDENQADTDFKSRQKFTSEVKKFVANNEVRLRAMHKDGFAVEVLRRLVMLVNMQGILVLPPLDGDVDDKEMLIKGYARPRPPGELSTWFEGRPTEETPYNEACWPMPMPTRTEEEQQRFREVVLAELPAFLFWLLFEFKMPSKVTGGRFVVRHWHHPVIVTELRSLSPDIRLWDLLVRAKVVFNEYHEQSSGDPAYWSHRQEWRGSSGDLEELLKKHPRSALSLDERKEIPVSSWLGRRLALCEKHVGKAYCSMEGGGGSRIWVIKPRPQDREAVKDGETA